jgi:hypothetical protein
MENVRPPIVSGRSATAGHLGVMDTLKLGIGLTLAFTGCELLPQTSPPPTQPVGTHSTATATRTTLDCSTDASHLMAAIVHGAITDFYSSPDAASSIGPEKAELTTIQSGLPVTPPGPVRNECKAAAVSTVDTNIVNREAVTKPLAPINSNLPYAVDAYAGHLLAGYAQTNHVPGRVKSDVGPNASVGRPMGNFHSTALLPKNARQEVG